MLRLPIIDGSSFSLSFVFGLGVGEVFTFGSFFLLLDELEGPEFDCAVATPDKADSGKAQMLSATKPEITFFITKFLN